VETTIPKNNDDATQRLHLKRRKKCNQDTKKPQSTRSGRNTCRSIQSNPDMANRTLNTHSKWGKKNGKQPPKNWKMEQLYKYTKIRVGAAKLRWLQTNKRTTNSLRNMGKLNNKNACENTANNNRKQSIRIQRKCPCIWRNREKSNNT